MAEITLSTLDENSSTSTAIHTGSENRHNDKHISPIQGVLQWPIPLKRKFKRNTERMPFVITCRAWKALFQEKLLHWRERHKEKTSNTGH
jgi:subtilase family serine protease